MQIAYLVLLSLASVPTAQITLDPPEQPIELPRDPLALVRPSSVNKVQSQMDGDLGSLSSEVVLPDPVSNTTSWIDPLRRWEWKREDSWKMPVTGLVYVYGQMNAASGEVYTTDAQLAGKTGLACQVPLGIAQIQLRSGPAWTCTDPLRPLLTHERAEWQMELQAKCPLVWGVGIEYQGQALPAITPLERDRFNQDLHLAFPICQGGQLKLGAKQQWESYNGQPVPTSDSSQIYLGFQLSR